jgi:hypothetical protein
MSKLDLSKFNKIYWPDTFELEAYWKKLEKREEIETNQLLKIKSHIKGLSEAQWHTLVKRFIEREQKLSEYWYSKHTAKVSLLMEHAYSIFETLGTPVSKQMLYEISDFNGGGFSYRGYTIIMFYGQGTVFEIYCNYTKELLFISK